MITKKKKCSRCRKDKSLDYFYSDSKSVDGFQSQCSSCKQHRTDRHSDKAIGHIPEMASSKSDHYTVAGLRIGSVIKMDTRKVLIEKVKVKKPGEELVVLKMLNKTGERLDERCKPFVLDKRLFIDALRYNTRLPEVA